MLGEAHRYLEAAAIYEELLKIQPENPLLLAQLANMLYMQGLTETDPAKIKSMNKRARVLAEKAEKLGTTSPLTPMLLASIRPDGSTAKIAKGTFSKHEDVEQLIREGEAAFGRTDYAKAVECYQKAFELEPTNYTAALLTGDAYFAERQLVDACEWFRKAIEISPETETAHRYLGDALAKRARRDEAFHEWIAALVCEPYLRQTRQNFTAQMRAAAEAKGRSVPLFPAMRSSLEGKQIKLSVDPDDGMLIMAYNICAMGWRLKEFAERFPNEKASRRSLPEEILAINSMLEVAESSKEPDKIELKKWQPVIDGLAALKREGLLEAYVFFERADKELAKDYPQYRAGHRAELERYIRLYWCNLE
jgi:tetratricopeptide (TPR) repeat protein